MVLTSPVYSLVKKSGEETRACVIGVYIMLHDVALAGHGVKVRIALRLCVMISCTCHAMSTLCKFQLQQSAHWFMQTLHKNLGQGTARLHCYHAPPTSSLYHTLWHVLTAFSAGAL